MTEADPYARLREALGREYRIERRVSETAAGAVYLAHDLTLHRAVMIRAISPALAGQAAAAAFGARTRLLAAIRHPGIPAVHHAESSGDFHYVVLEHAGGETVAEQLGRGPLAADELRRLGVELLDALEAARAGGIAPVRVSASTVVQGDGRYLLDGLWAAEPDAVSHESQDHVRAVRSLLAEAGGLLSPALRPVVQRARWSSAAEFRAALEAADRRPVPWGRLAAGAAMALLLATAAGGLLRRPGPPVPPPRELAILPLEVDGSQPLDPLGSSLAHLIQLNLDNVPGLELTSRRQVDQWWESLGRDALGLDRSASARELQAHWVVHGLVDRRPGDVLRIRLALHDSLGGTRALPELRGSAHDLAALGDSLALQIIRVVAPRSDSLYEPLEGLAVVPLGALKAFLQGEAAFAQDALALAQRNYEIALTADSTFALAEWRLANVKHWRRLPYELDLGSLYRRQAARLRPRDRALLEALIEPDLELRFARLDSVLRRYPADGYARLLHGEELFHRGPLVGRELEQSLPIFRDAVARDSSLALAYDHLVLAHARLGEREQTRRALELRRRVSQGSRPDDLDLLPFLELVYDERFVPLRAWARYRYLGWRRSPDMLAGVEKVARTGTPWLDMPHTQYRYSDLLLRAGRPAVETHATAHEGKGLALFALGRPAQALAEVDSAAALLDSPEARLQQAQWRVIPPALGLPAVDTAGWGARLEVLAGDPALGPRAAWSLAFAAGSTAEARRWSDRIPAGHPLRRLLEAQRAAADGDFALALARSDSARLAFQTARPPDVFAGAAFHLLRGDWQAALGDRIRADREWLWYEASDVEGWPQGLAQAGEVDGALGVFARLKRGRALLAPGATAEDTARACRQVRRIATLWEGAEPAVRPLAREAAALAERCPGD